MADPTSQHQEEAVHSLVRFIAEYPPRTKFFLNAWTWGYEVRGLLSQSIMIPLEN